MSFIGLDNNFSKSKEFGIRHVTSELYITNTKLLGTIK